MDIFKHKHKYVYWIEGDGRYDKVPVFTDHCVKCGLAKETLREQTVVDYEETPNNLTN